MHAATRSWIDWTAVTLGAGLAVLAVLGWRVEGGTQPPPAHVVLETAPPADLALTPAGVTSVEQDLAASGPGGGLERALTAANPTAAAVFVRVRALAASGALDEHLRVRVSRDGLPPVFDGTLGGLGKGSEPFALGAFESADLRVLAWLPVDADTGWEARDETIRLELTATPAMP